jgi:hypothetical protein
MDPGEIRGLTAHAWTVVDELEAQLFVVIVDVRHGDYEGEKILSMS